MIVVLAAVCLKVESKQYHGYIPMYTWDVHKVMHMAMHQEFTTCKSGMQLHMASTTFYLGGYNCWTTGLSAGQS